MANSYLSKTFGTPTDTKKYTMSVWVKRSITGSQQSIARSTNGNDDSHVFTFNSDDSLRWDEYGSSSTIGTLKTNKKFRDTSAWYHVVLWYDSANSTAGDRMRMWINGEEETSFATDTNPSLNAASAFNKASQPINIGRTSYSGGANYFNGYLAHMAFVDGANVAHTTFGETDSTSGIWKFKSPSGITWGTNGFHLKFENSGNLGLDSSSNASNWTVSGDLKQALDTPSNVHATFVPYMMNHTNGNSLQPDLSLGNLQALRTDSTWRIAMSTLAANKGKWYAEFKLSATSGTYYDYIGIYSVHGYQIANSSGWPYMSDMTNSYGLKDSNGNIHTGASGTSYGTSYSSGDIIGIALDLDNNKIFFSKNGTFMNSGDPANGTNGFAITADLDYVIGIQLYNSTWQANFGNGFFGTTAITSAGSNGNGSLFEYDVPTGFYAWNTKNINTYG